MNRNQFISLLKRERPTYRSSPMKYVYKILRLFLCPHRWDRISAENIVKANDNNFIVAEIRTFRCRHCGKEEIKKVKYDAGENES